LEVKDDAIALPQHLVNQVSLQADRVLRELLRQVRVEVVLSVELLLELVIDVAHVDLVHELLTHA